MKTFIECIPCLLRQTLECVRMTTDDEAMQERVLAAALRSLSEYEFTSPPPVAAGKIHRLLRDLTGCRDPYRALKQRFNRWAAGMYGQLRQTVLDADDAFDAAVRLAIAGNLIDFGVNGAVHETHVYAVVERVLHSPLEGDTAELAAAVSGADRVLYLADNAGELAFDRLLIEVIGPDKVILAVRGAPVLNDATLEDVGECGLPDNLRVINNGTDFPGTVLAECNAEFQRQFDAADVVIAKGQGNYETLSPPGRELFFLLQVKCPMVSRGLGLTVGTALMRREPPAVVV